MTRQPTPGFPADRRAAELRRRCATFVPGPWTGERHDYCTRCGFVEADHPGFSRTGSSSTRPHDGPVLGAPLASDMPRRLSPEASPT